jgi:Ca2+-dependent lipid-binding protein
MVRTVLCSGLLWIEHTFRGDRALLVTEASSDDLIGEATLETLLLEMQQNSPSARHERFDLHNKKGKPSGYVHAILQYWDPGTDPEPRLPPQRRVRVTVFSARALPKKDTFGRNDPFTTVTLGGWTQRTQTVSGGGSDPKWNDGGGESMEWCVLSEDAPKQVQVTVFDEDSGARKDRIGTCTLDISAKSRQQSAWSCDEWLRLEDPKERAAGWVHVLVQSWDPAQDPEPVVPSLRMLRVTVFEAKGLPKMDAIGKTDAFVECIVEGTIQRTTTAEDGGADPVWGTEDIGESFDFALMEPPERIDFRAFDDDVGDTDDLIGRGTLDLSKTPAPTSRWHRDEWVALRKRDEGRRFKGNSRVGLVRVSAQWFPVAPLQRRRRITLTVLEAKELPKMDLITANDPYVTVKIGDTPVKKTTTCSGGGSHPAWGGGQGEVLLWDIELSGIPRIEVRCFDEDVATADDEIGLSVLDLRRFLPDKNFEVGEWLQLRNAKGKSRGSVQVRLAWEADPAPPVLRGVHVLVREARQLKKMDLIGKNDAFVTVTIDELSERTSTVVDGGSAPVWNQGTGELLSLYPKISGLPLIRVQAFDADYGSADDEIGSCTLILREQSADAAWTMDEWVTLLHEGNAVGEVHITVNYDPEPPEPVRRGVRCTVLGCRNLPKSDIMGQNDPYCTVTVEGVTERTRTIDAGGANPVWNEGKGEILEYFPVVRDEPAIIVSCFDEDAGSDDLIGEAKVNRKQRPCDEAWEEMTWVTLQRNGKPRGEAQIKLQYDPEPPEPVRRGVRCTVLGCRNLPKSDIMGQNDPYCTVTVEGVTERTRTIDAGGANPVWNEGNGEAFTYDISVSTIPKITICCFDDDGMGQDDFIGSHVLHLIGV